MASPITVSAAPYRVHREIAPRVEDWPILATQLTTMLKLDYDWTDEVRSLPMPVLIVAGDADGLPRATLSSSSNCSAGASGTRSGTARV